MSRLDLVDVALGEVFADRVIRSAQLVNVQSGEIYPAGVAIKGERIAAVGDVDYTVGPETEVLDAEGRYLTPGLIDAHMHCYHSYLGVAEFTEAMLRHGVTGYADGFYGQGIVGGIDSVAFFKQAFERMPLRVLFLVPTIAYLQNRDQNLTAARGVSSEEMLEMLDWPGCFGLEEPPSGPIVNKMPEILELCEKTLEKRLVITGHGSGLDERRMQAYAAFGTTTDHEAVSLEEGLVRIRGGVKSFMRLATSADNQSEILRAVTEKRVDPRSLAFCSDEASPTKLVERGTTVENLRLAIRSGVDPITAVQMATLNAAEAFFAQVDLGQVAPGRFADMLLVDELREFTIDRVIVGGKTRVLGGELVEPLPAVEYPASLRNTIQLEAPVEPADLTVAAESESGLVSVRVIGVVDGDFATPERTAPLRCADGVVQPDLEHDVLPIAMIDRLGKGTGIGTGFAQGFGLRSGALGGTVNAVCENLILVGASFEDMAFAAQTLTEIGGGFIVVEGGEVKALVELPVLGMISDEPLGQVIPKFEALAAAAAELGCPLSSPFVSMEFTFCCGEVPEVKMSEEGLVRTTPGEILDVVIGPA